MCQFPMCRWEGEVKFSLNPTCELPETTGESYLRTFTSIQRGLLCIFITSFPFWRGVVCQGLFFILGFLPPIINTVFVKPAVAVHFSMEIIVDVIWPGYYGLIITGLQIDGRGLQTKSSSQCCLLKSEVY